MTSNIEEILTNRPFTTTNTPSNLDEIVDILPNIVHVLERISGQPAVGNNVPEELCHGDVWGRQPHTCSAETHWSRWVFRLCAQAYAIRTHTVSGSFKFLMLYPDLPFSWRNLITILHGHGHCIVHVMCVIPTGWKL